MNDKSTLFLWVLLYLICIFLFVFFCSICVGQESSYYHDPSLDAINNNVVILDSDLNSKQLGGGQTNGLTLLEMSQLGSLIKFGGSNTIGGVSYIYDSPTNTVGASSSNAFSSVSSVVSAINSNLVSSYSNVLADSSWTNGLLEGYNPDPSVSVISLGTFSGVTYNYNLGVSALPSNWATVGEFVRLFILAIFSVGVFFIALEYVQKEFVTVIAQGQVGGIQQDALSFNADAPTALAYIAIMVAALVGLAGFFAATADSSYLSNLFGSVANMKAYMVLLSANYPGWDVITEFCPIVGIVSVWLNYLLFRYIYGWPLFRVTQMLFKFLFR